MKDFRKERPGTHTFSSSSSGLWTSGVAKGGEREAIREQTGDKFSNSCELSDPVRPFTKLEDGAVFTVY